MQLLRLHIDNFGKLHNLDLDFTDGINVIKQPNAWGKSTIAAFIKVMLYGFDSKKASGLSENERSFYNPWQGGVYGGTLDFTVGSRSYRISRTFGASEKKDECHIYDLATNLESVDFNGNVGEQLFDLDSNSFKRSVFIAQNDCASTTSDAINAKLGNLAANTNDINNYESAQERLKAIANSLNPNRITGSIKKRKNLLTELSDELRGYDFAVNSLQEFTSKKKEAENHKANLQQERDNLANELKLASEDSRRRQLQKQYLELCADHVAKLEALEEFKHTFPVGLPEEEALLAATENARLLEEKEHRLAHLRFTEGEKEQYDKLEAMFGKSTPTEVEIDAMITNFAKISDVREEKTKLTTSLEEREKMSMILEPLPEKPKSINGLTIVGIVFAVLGILSFVAATLAFAILSFKPYYMFIGVALLVVATLLFAIAAVQQKRAHAEYERQLVAFKQRQQDEIDEISQIKEQADSRDQRIFEMEKEVRLFLERYRVFCGSASYSGALYEMKGQVKDFHRLNDRNKEIENELFLCRDIKAKLVSFAEEYRLDLGEDCGPKLIFLRTEAAKYKSAIAAVEEANQKKHSFEAAYDMEDLSKQVKAEGTLEEINEQILAYDSQIEQVRASVEQYSRQLEDLKEQLDAFDEKREELAAAKELQEIETHRYNMITRTQELLLVARERFTARYMAPISNAFRKYYDKVIHSTGDDWVIDANIAIKRREYGELRDVTHLSAGYQDLIGVCMRLALVDAMYQEEKPFLVLDDPFVNLDEEKTKKGMHLLAFVAEEYQTIYFTCHDSRTP